MSMTFEEKSEEAKEMQDKIAREGVRESEREERETASERGRPRKGEGGERALREREREESLKKEGSSCSLRSGVVGPTSDV